MPHFDLVALKVQFIYCCYFCEVRRVRLLTVIIYVQCTNVHKQFDNQTIKQYRVSQSIADKITLFYVEKMNELFLSEFLLYSIGTQINIEFIETPDTRHYLFFQTPKQKKPRIISDTPAMSFRFTSEYEAPPMLLA